MSIKEGKFFFNLDTIYNNQNSTQNQTQNSTGTEIFKFEDSHKRNLFNKSNIGINSTLKDHKIIDEISKTFFKFSCKQVR